MPSQVCHLALPVSSNIKRRGAAGGFRRAEKIDILNQMDVCHWLCAIASGICGFVRALSSGTFELSLVCSSSRPGRDPALAHRRPQQPDTPLQKSHSVAARAVVTRWFSDPDSNSLSGTARQTAGSRPGLPGSQ